MEEPPEDRTTAEVQRLCRLLDGLIRLKKAKYRDVDSLLGTSSGVARRILSGKIELKARHIFAILYHLGIEPKVFFRVAFESPGQEGTTDEVLLADQIQRLAGQHQEEPSIISRREIEHLVASLLESRGLIGPEAPDPSPPHDED